MPNVNRIMLTPSLVGNLPPGTYTDLGCRGLQLIVEATGARTWRLYRWLYGRPIKRRLGAWPALSLAAARKLAGVAPAAPAEPQVTLHQAAILYGKAYALYCIEHAWAAVAEVPVAKLTTERLQAMADEMPPMAGRQAVRILRAVLNFAVKRKMLSLNPAKEVETAKAVSRTVFLTEKELEVMLSCLQQMPEDAADFFTLALHTGMRKSNVLGLRTSWVDFTEKTITVPADCAKSGKEMTLILTPAAEEVIRRRGGDYIFPNRTGDGPRVDAALWLKDLRERMAAAGVSKHFTIHDLRRTFAVRLVRRGMSPFLVAAALGHNGLGTVMVYARTDTEMLKSVMLPA